MQISIMINSNDIRNHINDCTICGPQKDDIHPNGFSRTPNTEMILRIAYLHNYENERQRETA